jgi:hypothetical protein
MVKNRYKSLTANQIKKDIHLKQKNTFHKSLK